MSREIVADPSWMADARLLEDVFVEEVAAIDAGDSTVAIESAREMIRARQIMGYLQAERPEVLAEALAAVERALGDPR